MVNKINDTTSTSKSQYDKIHSTNKGMVKLIEDKTTTQQKLKYVENKLQTILKDVDTAKTSQAEKLIIKSDTDLQSSIAYLPNQTLIIMIFFNFLQI